MKKLSLAARKMILVLCVSALVIIAGGAIYYRSLEALAFALGVALSTALNFFKVSMLERNVKKILIMDDAGAGTNYIRLQYLMRYALTAVVLVAAALIPFINIWGAILGVLMMQVAVIAIRFMKIDEGAPPTAIDSVGAGTENGAEYRSDDEITDCAEIAADTDNDNDNDTATDTDSVSVADDNS